MDLTKFIQRCPCLLKKGSFSGISMGKHSGWRTSLLIGAPPSGVQHWIPVAFGLVSLKSGVWVMSWSTNCPHCITLWVSSSLGASTSGTTLILTSLAEGRLRSPPPVTELVFPFHTPSLYSGSRIRWKAVLAAKYNTLHFTFYITHYITSP